MAYAGSADVKSIVFNVIGGALVAVLAWLYALLSRKCRQWMLKRLLGSDFDKDGAYHIIYGSFILPPVYDQNGRVITHPYIKTPLPPSSPRRAAAASFSIDNPVSSCEMRSIAYLSAMFGKSRVCTPSLSPDNDMVSRVDVSFISLGGIQRR